MAKAIYSVGAFFLGTISIILGAISVDGHGVSYVFAGFLILIYAFFLGYRADLENDS